MLDETRRGTGRTTRMLEEARRLADEGKAVYVVAANGEYASRFKEILNTRSIVVLSMMDGAFSWRDCGVRDAHPGSVVLIDHYAAERRVEDLEALLVKPREAAHAFDAT